MSLYDDELKAFEYGHLAAIDGKEYTPQYDQRMECLLADASEDDDKGRYKALIDAWQSGYSDLCGQLDIEDKVDRKRIILVDHTVLLGHNQVSNELVYWNWMDDLSPLAAAAQAAFSWSLFQIEAYAARHAEQQELFFKLFNMLTDEAPWSDGDIKLIRDGITV